MDLSILKAEGSGRLITWIIYVSYMPSYSFLQYQLSFGASQS